MAKPLSINAKLRRDLTGYLFISPWLIGFLVFTGWPFLRSVYLSFTRYNVVTPPRWVGVANYRVLFTEDSVFWTSALITLKYAAVAVPLGIVAGVILALFLNADIKGIAVYRTLFFLPSIVPTVATAAVFMWILNPQMGLVNLILGWFGVTGPAWLSDVKWSFWSLVFMGLWGVGGSMVIYLAGLKDIPTYLYEAATMDGASSWRKTVQITLPMLTPVIFFNLVMGVIGAFNYFTEAFVMTKGGPEGSTTFYALYLFQRAWDYLDMGYASAMAWVLFLIVVVITGLLFHSQRKWVHFGR